MALLSNVLATVPFVVAAYISIYKGKQLQKWYIDQYWKYEKTPLKYFFGFNIDYIRSPLFIGRLRFSGFFMIFCLCVWLFLFWQQMK